MKLVIIVFCIGIIIGVIGTALYTSTIIKSEKQHAEAEGYVKAYCDFKKLGMFKENNQTQDNGIIRSIVNFDICPIPEEAQIIDTSFSVHKIER